MAGMAEDFSLYSLRNCKIIYLVRHGQGYHNVAGENNYSAYESYEYFDASLTPLGWSQVDLLHKNMANRGVAEDIELVVTSPLMRTMQTAVGAFGKKEHVIGDSLPPLMVANAGNSKRSAISSSGCPPVVALECCREHMGIRPCDKRQSISTYRTIFPAIDFSMIERDDDILWKADTRETEEELYQRGRELLAWLLKRMERRIAVVSHSSFLNHMLRLCGHDCAFPIQKELWRGFTNCEMRAVVLANRRALGAPISEDSGGISLCPDIPVEATVEEMIENGDTMQNS
eukprot:c17818_g1_i1 orf=416-1276(-)